jgi:hypothetical protein
MEDSHYDEFGNYIGPALSDSDVVSTTAAGRQPRAFRRHAEHVTFIFATSFGCGDGAAAHLLLWVLPSSASDQAVFQQHSVHPLPGGWQDYQERSWFKAQQPSTAAVPQCCGRYKQQMPASACSCQPASKHTAFVWVGTAVQETSVVLRHSTAAVLLKYNMIASAAPTHPGQLLWRLGLDASAQQLIAPAVGVFSSAVLCQVAGCNCT